MTIEFTTAYTKSPVVEFSWPVEALQTLFEQCRMWNQAPTIEGMGYLELSKRLIKHEYQFTDKNTSWQELVEAVDNSKLQLVKQILSIDTENRWPPLPETIAEHLHVYMYLVTDLEGYSMPAHLDTRSVFAAGYLNVFENESLTEISNKRPSLFNRSKYRAPGKQGQGVLWLNTENSWHWVNKSSKIRRSIFFSIQLIPWN